MTEKTITVDDIRVGEIIVYQKRPKSFFGNRIRLAQLDEGFSPEDSMYSHTEVYIGDGYAIDANPKGVKPRNVIDRQRGRYIKVVRPRFSDYDLRREGVAIWSATRCNLPYGFFGVIWFKVKRVFKVKNFFSAFGDFCSELCAWGIFREYNSKAMTLSKNSIKKITKYAYGDILPRAFNEMMPASFLDSEYFIVVNEGVLVDETT